MYIGFDIGFYINFYIDSKIMSLNLARGLKNAFFP